MFNPNSKTNKGGYEIKNKREYPCICKNCGNTFKGSSNTKQFCSDECESRYRKKEHINEGKCLCCQKELTLKQIKNNRKFCNNSCATKYNNMQRTAEENERIKQICSKSQTKIMCNKDEIAKRISKRIETINNWDDEKKQNHKELLRQNAIKQNNSYTAEQKEEINIKRKNTNKKNKANGKENERIQKIKDNRLTWDDEKKKMIQEKINKKRRTSLFLKMDHLDDFNHDYVNKVFVSNQKFLFYEFAKYFNIAKSTAYIFKNLLGITYQNKQKTSRFQQELFDSIKAKNKILNDRNLIKPLELDIVLPDIKLAIEYNGLMYHSSGDTKYKQFQNTDKDYHLNKTNLVESKGYQLFHIFESDNIEIWKSMINYKIGLCKKIYARKCMIKEVNNDDAKDFLDKNHIQGFCNSKIKIGLYFKDELVSLMTFGKPRFNKKYEWELLRFCSKCDYVVIGSASKLLNHFRKNYKGSIISYANRRWSNGNLYKKLGFIEINKTKPNYFYFKENENLLYSRHSFQKHKLAKLLQNFDSNLSEEQNMFDNGYRQIFDCGNIVFALE